MQKINDNNNEVTTARHTHLTRDIVPFAKFTIESDNDEDNVMQNTLISHYVIRYTCY